MNHHCGRETCQMEQSAPHLFCECDCEMCEANTERLASYQANLERKAKITQFHHRVARMLRCRGLNAPEVLMERMSYEVIRCLAGMSPEYLPEAFETLPQGIVKYNAEARGDDHDDSN